MFRPKASFDWSNQYNKPIQFVSKQEFLKAAEDGDLKTIELYVKQNKKDLHALNVLTADADTALHLAVRGGHLEIVKYLLAQDHTDLNVRNNYGQTPLHLAVAFSMDACIEALLACERLDMNVVNNDGETAVCLALQNTSGSLQKLLDHSSMDIAYQLTNKTFQLAIPRMTEISRMISRAQDRQKQSAERDTDDLIFMAAEIGDLKVLKRFIETYDDPNKINCQDKDGNTILHIASANNNSYFVRALLIYSPHTNPAIKNLDGMTASDVATKCGSRDCEIEFQIYAQKINNSSISDVSKFK